MKSYQLSRVFVDWAIDNPSKVKPEHYAIYFYAIERCNRLTWKKEFGLPAFDVMEVTGIKSYNSYKKYFEDLVEFGFFEVIQRSKNQHTACIIALSFFDKADAKQTQSTCEAHDKATQKQVQGTCNINKLVKTSKNLETNNEEEESAPEELPVWALREKQDFQNLVAQENTPPVAPPPPYDWSNLATVLFADRWFVEDAMRRLKVDKSGLMDLIIDFSSFQQAVGKPINRKYEDLKRHILNYGLKQQSAPKPRKSNNEVILSSLKASIQKDECDTTEEIHPAVAKLWT